MTRRPLPDLATLTAQLRLAALALVAELAEWLGAGGIAAALRGRMMRDLGRLERFATGIVVLTALRTLPAPLSTDRRGGVRPRQAQPGFARVAADDRAMRAMQRKLFPRERDLTRRLVRFDAILDDVATAALRLVRHITRLPPTSRLIAIAPPAFALASVAIVACFADDTS